MALSNQLTENAPLAVIKVGGDVLVDAIEREGLAQNVKELHQLGWNIIILHGGGPQVNRLQELHGLKTNKVAGRRITSASDLKVVKQAIAGEVNVDLVSLLIGANLPAFGCSGASGKIIKASKRQPIKVSGEGDKLIDFGEVGDVQSVNQPLLSGLLALGQIPVIATLGIDDDGRIFNINADTTVIEIAKALKADLLLLITQIGGIYKDISQPDSLIHDITPKQAKALIAQGVIRDGMIPKVEEAIKSLEANIKAIAIASPSNLSIFKEIANDPNNLLKLNATRIHA